MQTPSPAVVVGVDGSTAATAAVEWGVAEAHRRSAPLRVVHALDQRHSKSFLLANPLYVAAERHAARQILDAAVEQARDADPDLDVRQVLEVGLPPAVLIEQSATASVVVVGCRGLGGFAGLLLGSTSLKVAMHAACAVVVVRGAPGASGKGPSAGRIVAGTDCSPSSEHALRFAFARSRHAGLGLTVVHAWRAPAISVDAGAFARAQHAEKEQQALLAERLAPWRARYPEVDVVDKVVAGNAGGVLVDESAGAEMLVVGSRGRGGVGGLLLGSVSHAVLHHARCPVAVVRH